MRRHLEIIVIVLLGLMLFAGLNCIVLAYAPDEWTNTHIGPWSAFHHGFDFSGFDQVTYIVITQWRPLYTHLRHPALMYMMWPFAQLNGILKEAYGINFAIYIVAVVWTLLSTLSWVTLYKIFRKVQMMTVTESLLLNFFFYSFAYVMLATFAPDHMLLSMTVMLLMLYLSGKAMKQGKQLATWKVLLLYLFGTGISTTNGIKIWLVDAACRLRKGRVWAFVKHSLLYIIPTMIVAALYIHQEHNANVEEERYQKRIEAKAMRKDSVGYKKDVAEREKKLAARVSKQLVDNPLFEFTDNTIPLMPTLVENIYGEGLQLHEDYLLRDANIIGERPVIVKYTNRYNYIVEALILLLFFCGVVVGCRQRFLWMCMMPFLFDMLLHVGLRFALTDVYIMTAHWAFVIPVAVAYLVKKLRRFVFAYRMTIILLVCMTFFLLTWNLRLIFIHFL